MVDISGEQRCLNDAIIACSNDVVKRNIVSNVLKSTNVNEKSEAPDFIRTVEMVDNTLIIGIEHFSVYHDVFYDKKRTPHSSHRMIESKAEKIQEKYKGKIGSADLLSEVMNDPDMKYALNYGIQNKFKSDYTTFIDSFKHGFNTHMRNMRNKYIENIRSKGFMTEDISFCFVIEMEIDYRYKILKDEYGFHTNNRNIVIFSDMLEYIKRQTNDVPKLEWIIFVVRNKDSFDAIPVRVSNMEEDLKKQGILLYTYLGFDVHPLYRQIRNDVGSEPIEYLYNNTHTSVSIDLPNNVAEQQRKKHNAAVISEMIREIKTRITKDDSRYVIDWDVIRVLDIQIKE